MSNIETSFRPRMSALPAMRRGLLTGLIGLVDSRELTRHFLEQWLLQVWPASRIVPAPTARLLLEALRAKENLRFILLSVSAGQATAPSTLGALGQLSRACPACPVILMAEGENADDVDAAIEAGAKGYVPTSLNRTAAIAAINTVLDGGTFAPVTGPASSASPRRVAARGMRLSPRELEVVGRLREGKPNKTIAYELAISESTVKVFVRRILAKLGAANRTEAVALIERSLPSRRDAA